MTKRTNKLANESSLTEQLEAVYGSKLARKILVKLKRHKSAFPNKNFAYVFAEDGSFKATEKKLSDEEPEELFKEMR